MIVNLGFLEDALIAEFAAVNSCLLALVSVLVVLYYRVNKNSEYLDEYDARNDNQYDFNGGEHFLEKNPMQLCQWLAAPILDPKDTFEKLLNFAREDFPETGEFDLEWFRRVLIKINELYYHSLLFDAIFAKYDELELTFDIEDAKVAGFVLQHPGYVTFCMNRQMFIDLFQNKNSTYHAGGRVCADRLVCLLQVILHETVHMALLVCKPRELHHHSAAFNKISAKLFGHCDSQHGLIPGLNPEYDLEDIRTRLKPGKKVRVYINSSWVPAKITKINRKKVYLINRERKFSVHPGLIKDLE